MEQALSASCALHVLPGKGGAPWLGRSGSRCTPALDRVVHAPWMVRTAMDN